MLYSVVFRIDPMGLECQIMLSPLEWTTPSIVEGEKAGELQTSYAHTFAYMRIHAHTCVMRIHVSLSLTIIA